MEGIPLPIRRRYLWYALLYLLFLTGVVISADLGLTPWLFAPVRAWPYSDKICHLVLMGIFSYLLNTAFHCATVRLGWMKILLGSLIVGSLATLEEFSQVFIERRSCNLLDLLSDLAGIYLFGLLAGKRCARFDTGGKTIGAEGDSTWRS